MGKILSLFSGWQGYAALAALCLLVGAFGSWRVMSWKEGAAETKQVQQTIKYVIGASQITYDISMKYEGIKTNDQRHTDDLVGIVPVTITPAIDVSHPVPCGFVRLYDAAAGSPIPDATCQPNDSSSGVALSDVAETTIKNFGQYDQVSHQLLALQDWIKQQQSLSEKGP